MPFFLLLCAVESAKPNFGSGFLPHPVVYGTMLMHTVAAASLQLILQARKPPPNYTQSLTVPIMETNMKTQILRGIFLVLSQD